MQAESVKAVKSVKFSYLPTPQSSELLQTFRMMVNHAIRICLKENIRGRLKLRDRIYEEFQEGYEVVSYYPYSVAEVAWSIVKKHRNWQRKPIARRLMLKMEASAYSLNYAILSLPFKKGERILVPLRYGDYQRSFLLDKGLKRGSIIMTESAICIAFSKQIESVPPLRKVGYDLNQKSIVGSDWTRINLSEVARLHTEYGTRRRDFNSKHPNDRRLNQKFASSRREKERVRQYLHGVAKQIVNKAKENQEGIVLERLKGIRYAHQKGNSEGSARRRRIALWPFRQLQTYIHYTAVWAGVPVEYVPAARTSQTCNMCNFVNRKLKLHERSWLCPQCGCQLDRDLNAAINIQRRGKMPCLGEVRPGARGTDEAMKGNETTTPILLAEAPKGGT